MGVAMVVVPNPGLMDNHQAELAAAAAAEGWAVLGSLGYAPVHLEPLCLNHCHIANIYISIASSRTALSTLRRSLYKVGWMTYRRTRNRLSRFPKTSGAHCLTGWYWH